jgi:hypothetical protein
MNLARPLFSLLLLALAAASALAADPPEQLSSTAQNEPAARSPAQEPAPALEPSSGFQYLTAQPQTFTPLLGKSLARLDGDLCYTLRMYKVKPTEHLRAYESGFRGESTCEMAKNYQVRSAVAHARPAADPNLEPPQK